MAVEQKQSGLKELSSHQIVTIAVYLLGGDVKYIDTEDVAVKASEIAPGRFAWKKYPHQINIENVRTFLSDAKKAKNGAYLTGSGKKGWLLTPNGIDFVRGNIQRLNGRGVPEPGFSARDRQWIEHEGARLLASAAYETAKTLGVRAVSLSDIWDFFRLDVYTTDDNRLLKIRRALNAFGDHPELGPVVRAFAERLQEEKK
jgi:hypothetical protein